MMVIKWEWLLELTGRGPTRSACMWVNLRAGTGIFWTGADGWVVIFAFWQVLHSAPPANISGHTSPYETGCNQVSGGLDTWMYQGVNGGGGYQQPLLAARGVTTDGEMADRYIFQEK